MNSNTEDKTFKMITQYVRNSKKTKIGALVALLNSADEIVIGHSKWCKSKDAYKKGKEMEIAIARAITDRGNTPAYSLRNPIDKFVRRAKKYFKTDKLSKNTIKLICALKEKSGKQLEEDT